MREIKFRVWDIDNKRMFNNSFELKNKGLEIWAQLENLSSDNLIWEQFTGLKDKNGKDIYEGDKIKVCNNKKGSLTVVFVNEYVGGWVLIHESTKNKLSLGARKQSDIEVIGNIHENKTT